MKPKIKMWLTMMVGMSLLLGGCQGMNNSKDPEKVEPEEKAAGNDKQNDYEKENFVPIQEYTGEGYTLRDSQKETGEIAEKHHDDVVKAVKQYFQETYATEVKVHNIVSAVDGVSVFVESIGEPHFYTFAIVPVDVANKKVDLDGIWSQEGEVERAITGGLYAMAFEEEFSKLNKYLEGITQDFPVVGTPIEAIENIEGNGYTTPYYFISPTGDLFDELFERYIQNPEMSKEELRTFFNESNFESHNLLVGIEFYMEKNVEPDKEILNKLVTDIEEMDGIPRGEYSIYLNDNYIDKRRGSGIKDNTLERTTPDKIMK